MARSVALALVGVILGGCSTDEDQPSPATGSAVSEPETGTSSGPNTGSERPRVLETAVTGLAAPWGLDFLPDGDAVVTERDTRRVLRISGPRHEVSELATIDIAAPQGEAGLLGVAVSPDFATDRLLYLYVSTAEDNRVVRAPLEGAGLGELETVLSGIPNGFIHDGGRLEFGPDGYLYVSTGEGGEPDRSQDRESLGGKILRITPDGQPAPGNPFGTEVWSWGHRNVQGLAFAGNRLWASEFGASAFDELNLVEPGANYGWPEVEGEGGTSSGFTDPQVTWETEDASPSGLAYADGYLWLAALRGERLWRVAVDGERASDPTAYLVGEHGRMRTVAVAPDGNLWLTTSNRDGRGTVRDGDDRILVLQP